MERIVVPIRFLFYLFRNSNRIVMVRVYVWCISDFFQSMLIVVSRIEVEKRTAWYKGK